MNLSSGARRVLRPSLALCGLILALVGTTSGAADPARRVPDTYTATTAAMTPAGVKLKIDILDWSSDAARADAVAALSAGSDVAAALRELPTAGYVWVSGTGVGYAVKYAARQATADGGERVTLVTDRRLGAYDFMPWTAAASTATQSYDYSVLELVLADGNGAGTTSLAADVALDADKSTVALASTAATPQLLTGAKHEPRPYWAN